MIAEASAIEFVSGATNRPFSGRVSNTQKLPDYSLMNSYYEEQLRRLGTQGQIQSQKKVANDDAIKIMPGSRPDAVGGIYRRTYKRELAKKHARDKLGLNKESKSENPWPDMNSSTSMHESTSPSPTDNYAPTDPWIRPDNDSTVSARELVHNAFPESLYIDRHNGGDNELDHGHSSGQSS